MNRSPSNNTITLEFASEAEAWWWREQVIAQAVEDLERYHVAPNPVTLDVTRRAFTVLTGLVEDEHYRAEFARRVAQRAFNKNKKEEAA